MVCDRHISHGGPSLRGANEGDSDLHATFYAPTSQIEFSFRLLGLSEDNSFVIFLVDKSCEYTVFVFVFCNFFLLHPERRRWVPLSVSLLAPLGKCRLTFRLTQTLLLSLQAMTAIFRNVAFLSRTSAFFFSP